MDSVPPLEIINEEKEYKNEHDQWTSETGLTYVKEVIKDYWTRVLSQTYKRKE